MEIAVISDLHLGAGDSADGFGHEDSEFLKFLEFLERNFQKVVLLGDIWETLTGQLPGNPGRELELAMEKHPEIARRFERANYIYVHGNHDLVAGADGVPDELFLHANGQRILFTHGHQQDDVMIRKRWLSELGIWLGGWIRRLGLEAFYRLLTRIDDKRNGVTLDSSRCPFQRWAIEMAAERQVDIVVTGHTHLAARGDHGARLFLNSGSCSDGQFSFLSMDTRRGHYAVNAGW